MASDILVGRQSAHNGDIGVGEAANNETRLTLFTQLGDDYWLTHLGMHVGWGGSGGYPTAYASVYDTNAQGNAVNRVAVSPGYQARARMALTAYGGGEQVQQRLAAPVLLRRNVVYLGGVTATGNAMPHAMNNDGSQMSRDYGNAYPPATFQTEVKNAQGRMSVWGIVRKNEPPNAPSNVSPAPGSQTTSQQPVISGDFRDVDETLTGFGVGQADHMTAFQVIIYNQNKTAVLYDSGGVEVNPAIPDHLAMRNNRRFALTPPVLPTGQTYTVRTAVRDRAGAWSQGTEWQFTILSGGSITINGPEGRIATQTPAANFVYTHRNGVPMQSVEARVVEFITAAPLRGPVTTPFVLASGAPGAFTWPAGWAALPRGVRAHFGMRPVDANGVPGAWSNWSPMFQVNQFPPAPANLSPEAGEIISERRPFRVTVAADADGDMPSGYTVRATIGVSGSGVTTEVPMQYIGMSGDSAVFQGTPTATNMPSFDVYQWTVYAVDQFGEAGPSTSVTFTYAQPPTITITAPTTTVETPAPVVTYTSSPVATQHRVRLVDPQTNAPVFDTGLVVASGTVPVPSGKVRTGKEYDLIVGVKTGLGAYAETVRRISVVYPVPAALPNQTVTLAMGEFDIPGDPSVVRVGWNDPQGPEGNRGYGIYRAQGTGDFERVGVVTNPAARTFDDDTAPMNDTLRYYVTRFQDVGLDTLESAVPTTIPAVTVNFGGTILSDVHNPGVNRIVMRYWLNRDETPERARETKDGWGRFPVVFHGERKYTRLTGTWDVEDEIGFTATELKNAAIRLADPVLEQIQASTLGGPSELVWTLKPRLVCYRDGLGRVHYGHLSIGTVEDTHAQPHNIPWTFIETTVPYPVPAPTQDTVETDNQLDPLEGLFGGSWM